MGHPVVLYVNTNVSEEHDASVFRVKMSIVRMWFGLGPGCKGERRENPVQQDDK
jgi:hypothetical protein